MKFQLLLIPAVLSLLLPVLQAAAFLSVDALTQFCTNAPYQKFLEFLAESSSNVDDGDDGDSSRVSQPFNELDSNGFGCLHAAILAHNEANVYALITRAAGLNLNLNLRSSSIKGGSSSSSLSSLTALQLAAISGQSKVFKYFLFRSPADVLPNLLAVRDELGSNLLHLASANGHVAIVHLLAREKPALFAQFACEKRIHDGHSALSLAVAAGHGFVVEALLQNAGGVGGAHASIIQEIYEDPSLVMTLHIKDLLEQELMLHQTGRIKI